MRTLKNLVRLVPFLSLLVAVAGNAQLLPEPTRKYGTLGADKTAQDNGEKVIRFENELNMTIELPAIVLESCPARVALDYYQKNTLAHVKGEIELPECAGSAGEFNVVASIRDDDGNRTSLSFPETWQTVGQASVTFERDYPIGENVTLMQIRSSRVTCSCAELPAEGN